MKDKETIMLTPCLSRGALTLAVALLLTSGGVSAHEKHDHHSAQPQASKAESAEIDLRERTLVDQNGNEVKFVSEVLGEKLVVMDFVFTHCTNVCPVLSAVLLQVQRRLGEQADKDVMLVSVTVDPVRDTPKRLNAYAAKYSAGPGWIWLTGPKPVVDDVLTGLGAYSVNFADHPSMVLVGDARSGQWSRFFGFPSPDQIMERLNQLKAARGKVAAGR
jgi:protein SCO1/2